MADNEEESSELSENDLVNLVAEVVYELLLHDARLDSERYRLGQQHNRPMGGL